MVLLTNKKPEPKSQSESGAGSQVSLPPRARRRRSRAKGKLADEEEGLRDDDEADGDDPVLWQLGEASDDEDGPSSANDFPTSVRRGAVGHVGGEHAPIMAGHAADEEHRESTSSDATLARPEIEGTGYVDDEFGDWNSPKP